MILNISSIIFTLLCCVITYSNAQSSPYEYCFQDTDEGIASRSIPARQGETKAMDLSMKQVHMVMRHGARIPGSYAGSTCFNKMKEDPIEWDCIYTEVFQGSSNTPEKTTINTMSFQKVFDTNPDDNFFGGTCERGQLTVDAIPQMNNTGDVVFGSYFDGPNSLFTLEELYNNPGQIYFRSTYYQRTMHSGALMFSRLFTRMSESTNTPINDDFIMDVHLIDEGRDPMRNTNIGCADFDRISWDFIHSNENKAMFEKNKDIHNLLREQWGKDVPTFWYWDAIDCFGSMVCKDKQEYLPEVYQITADSPADNEGMRLFRAIEEEHALYTKWNNAEVSKCATNDFFYDFKQGFNIYQAETYGINDPTHQVSRDAKFLLYSAHDSTLMHFVSAIDDVYDDKWPGYGSTFYVEVYEDVANQNSYFRAIYNGQDRTDKIKGCSQSETWKSDGVCEMSHFMESMSWVTKTELPRPGDDTYPRPIENPYADETKDDTTTPPEDNKEQSDNAETTSDSSNTYGWAWMIGGIAIGAVAAGGGMYAYGKSRTSKYTTTV